ncbi:MAG: hypothetical protein JNJ86_16835 [Chitinophagaceae bacterium]|nr:hypothetical protein [Chitinophagaceae bacterium]
MKNKELLSQFHLLLNNYTKQAGFSPYQDCGVARITNDHVFQLIYVHEHRFSETFTIEIVSRPLFYPTDILTLTPGNRLNKFASKGKVDKWWDTASPEQLQASFHEISQLLQVYAFPFFEATGSGKGIKQSRRTTIFGRSRFGKRVYWGAREWDLFETGHLHLWNGDLKAARTRLNDAHDLFSADKREWAAEAARDCLLLLALTEKGPSYISSYLDMVVRQSREKLGLLNWFPTTEQAIAIY